MELSLELLHLNQQEFLLSKRTISSWKMLLKRTYKCLKQ